MPDVSDLVDAAAISQKLKGSVSAERILELAEAGMLPHYRVDEKVMFGYAETKEWVNHNLVVRVPGVHIGNAIVTVATVHPHDPYRAAVPLALAYMRDRLIPIPISSPNNPPCSGIYFLVKDGEDRGEPQVVYVGQSSHVMKRITDHVSEKVFDRAYFIRVPKTDLNYVEGELIRALRPKYNFSKTGKLVAPGCDSGFSSEASREIVREAHWFLDDLYDDQVMPCGKRQADCDGKCEWCLADNDDPMV